MTLKGLRKFRDFRLELRYAFIQLPHDGFSRRRRAQIDARALEKVHRIVAAAGPQQIEKTFHSFAPLIDAARCDPLNELRRRGVTRRVLINIVRAAEEVRNPRPGNLRDVVIRHGIAVIRLEQIEIDYGSMSLP